MHFGAVASMILVYFFCIGISLHFGAVEMSNAPSL